MGATSAKQVRRMRPFVGGLDEAYAFLGLTEPLFEPVEQR